MELGIVRRMKIVKISRRSTKISKLDFWSGKVFSEDILNEKADKADRGGCGLSLSLYVRNFRYFWVRKIDLTRSMQNYFPEKC
jgi:hypothetical protein